MTNWEYQDEVIKQLETLNMMTWKPARFLLLPVDKYYSFQMWVFSENAKLPFESVPISANVYMNLVVVLVDIEKITVSINYGRYDDYGREIENKH